MTNQTQIIEAVTERDVDILLLEELNVNVAFVAWLVDLLDLPKLSSINGAWRSISGYGLGETDLLLSYRAQDKNIFVLMENKLDAEFQELQFERYVQRGEKYKSEQKCDEYYSVLIAPKKYAKNQNSFEYFITYEEIKEFLVGEKNQRLDFKAKLLDIAIEKSRRGYRPINCEPVQKFWKSYYVFKEAHFPNLKMKKPTTVPQQSDWIELKDEDLKDIKFYHKLEKGFADTTFFNFSEENQQFVRDSLPEQYQLVKHKKNFSIRQKIEPINRMEDFDKQMDKVKFGLEKISELNDFVKTKLMAHE